MKKLIGIVSLLLAICMMLGSCATSEGGDNTYANFKPEKPDDTELEFWVGDDVSSYDFSDYEMIENDIGFDIYYGKGYSSKDADNYVKYVISSGKVVSIVITDPDVDVWGISTETSKYDFVDYFEFNGYRVEELAYSADEYTYWYSATKGRFSVKYKRGDGDIEIRIVYDIPDDDI